MNDLILEARKTWWEIVSDDGGECRLMGIVRELADEVEDWERSFDMYWRANRRATALWHAAHPDQKAILPDQGKMIDWLCDELERSKR